LSSSWGDGPKWVDFRLSPPAVAGQERAFVQRIAKTFRRLLHSANGHSISVRPHRVDRYC
ncbi:hypothetical protein, partial [Burkholderia ubonensis]|uniref:hypothetical protein n=1 Tax=Burkholderia ubonensis TaxID=101571 RepID=UPI001E2A8C55